jgi:DNA-binding LacI/PurR family transcriptional regulator
MGKKQKDVVQIEIARLAKVSPATVSRVINKTARVSPQTLGRIRLAAKRLGVDVRRKKNPSKLLVFLLGNRSVLHPFHSQVLIAAEAYCAERDYSLVFFPIHYSANVPWDAIHPPRLLQRADLVDGFIVAGTNTRNLLELLTNIGLPSAVFGDTMQGTWKKEHHDVVWIDDITGGYEVARYLQSLGHRRIWYVANTGLTWFQRRYQGYCRAMKEAGLEPLAGSLESDKEHEVGFLATKRIWTRDGGADAIFAGSDATCHGVYAALRDLGLSVPQDVSVVGFNDTPEATVLHPALTSVRVFPEQVGRSLAELVLNRCEDPGLPPLERMIPTQLVRRESCRAAVLGGLPRGEAFARLPGIAP